VSLADRIQAARPEPRKLTLKEWLISLDEKDRSAAEDMARDTAWTNQRMVEFLAELGVGVGKDAIAAWRSRCGYSR
jgi:transposase